MLDILPASARIIDLRSDIALDRDGLTAAVAAEAGRFAEAGIVRGTRIVVGHSHAAAFLIDLFAGWQLGATVVCLPPSLTRGERDLVAETVKPALWVGEEGGGTVRCLRPAVPTGPHSGRAAVTPAEVSLDDAALILMTSGTTSAPKGVVHTHRSLRSRLALNIAHIGATDLARTLTLLPMHFGHGLLGNALTPLAAGGTLYALPDPGVDGLARLGEIIDRNAITFLSSVPAMWQIALRTAQAPVDKSLARVHIGSAPLSADLWRKVIGWAGIRRVVNMYGITETANWIGGANAEEIEPADGLVGRAWGGAIRVRGEDGKLSDRGKGEIAVATPSIMAGYLDRPDLTAAAIDGAWFLTGDSGEIDGAGALRLTGRRKNEINRAGIKVPAEEIDLLLERHPGVREACAFGLDDAVAGEVVAVAIVAEPGQVLDHRALAKWCAERIRREAVPARFFVVGAIPRTDRGKINRDTVRAAVMAPERPA
jgi:acyl-CoA synthetase (AMP-forming)/AMP-acid ligase II